MSCLTPPPGGVPSFTSSIISSGGSDPDVTKWGAQRVCLSIRDVQQSILEGRLVGTGVWNIEGNESAEYIDSGSGV
jgi:hypothetical protein